MDNQNQPRCAFSGLRSAVVGSLVVILAAGACNKDTGLYECSPDGWCRSHDEVTSKALHAIWGQSAQNIWAVGAEGIILHFDGSAWTPQVSGTTHRLSTISGLAEGDVWAAGEQGTLLRFNGTSWLPVASRTTAALSGIYTDATGEVWAVGQGGAIIHRGATDAAFELQNCGQTGWLTSIWGSSRRQVWAAGQNGVLCKWNGNQWSKLPAVMSDLEWDDSPASAITAVWGSSSQSAWGLQESGALLHFQGSKWENEHCALKAKLRAGWGKRATMILVGNQGFIASPSTTNCPKEVRSGTDQTLLGVWGVSPGVIWAVGTEGIILNYQSAAVGAPDE